MKYSIRLTLLQPPQANGTHTIRLRVSWNGQRITHYLDNAVRPEEWDAEKHTPKKSAHRAYREVEDKTAAIGRVFDKAHLEQTIPTPTDLHTALGHKAPSATSTGHDLQTALREFRNEQRNGWSLGTYTRFGVLANHLKEWRPQATVEELDRNALSQYVDYLYTRGLVNSTISKNVSWVRWFLHWCYDKGYTTSDFDHFRPRFKGSDQQREVIYLTEDELRSILDLDLSAHPTLDRVRDVFLFLCFSGLRYSDVAKLRRSDISTDHIRVVTKKTSDPLNIELNHVTSAILSKYDSGNPNDIALPVVSNQKMNDKLKDLARLAGINTPVRKVTYIRSERIEEVKEKWQVITTHCGRRTFIVTALYLDIHTEVIRKWTGHKGDKAMRPYIAIVDKQKRENMAKFDGVLTEI